MAFRWWVAAGIVVAAVLGALANFVPWGVAALLGVGAGVLNVVGSVWLERRNQPVDLVGLAARVREQWRAETQSRGVSLAAPLNVRWQATGRDVSAPAGNIVGREVAGRPIRVRASGDLHDLAAKFRTLTNKQLVILGEPGAGKTVLAVFLALDLLTGEPPVPVVLPVSGWDPDQPLYDWAADRLSRDYPKVGPWKTWRDLLRDGRLLPILDGLDEMRDGTRALAEINTATDGGRPFVLTCRAEEYERFVRSTGTTLTSALVVELAPVTPRQIEAYLDRPGQENRWTTLLAAPGPLTRVLAVPFMTALARFAYARPETDPTELGGLDEDEIRTRLLGAVLPEAYAPKPHPDLGTTGTSPYTAAQATRWLTFLARRMPGEFAWWRLHETLTGWRAVALRLFLPAVWLGALVGNAVGWRLADVWAGGVVPCMLAGMAIGLVVPVRPRRPGRIDRAVDLRALKLGAMVALVVMLGFGWLAGPGIWRVIREHSTGTDVVARVLEVMVLIAVVFGVAGIVGWAVYFFRVRPRLDSGALSSVVESIVADRQYLFYGNAIGYMCMGLLVLFYYPDVTGVLRQAGTVYQFRHAVLERYLAESRPTPR